MDLRGIANGAIQPINGNILVTWTRPDGTFLTDAAGHRTANVTTSTVAAQVQALSANDLQHIDGLNIQGIKRAVYLYGDVQGIVRSDQKGGDILTFSGHDWRVVQVLETWHQWCKVVVVMQ
jgi:hypothetical protein